MRQCNFECVVIGRLQGRAAGQGRAGQGAGGQGPGEQGSRGAGEQGSRAGQGRQGRQGRAGQAPPSARMLPQNVPAKTAKGPFWGGQNGRPPPWGICFKKGPVLVLSGHDVGACGEVGRRLGSGGRPMGFRVWGLGF